MVEGFSQRFSSSKDDGASVQKVDTVDAPSEEDVPAMRSHLQHVFAEYVSKNVPVILKGGVSHWPCTYKWTDEHIVAGVGDCRLRVRKNPQKEGHVFGNVSSVGTDDVYEWEDITVAEYVRAMKESPDKYYAARIPLQVDLEEIGNEVPPPKYLPYAATVGAEVPGGAIMYWGAGKQRTPLHYDPHENFLCMLDGSKKIRLYHPSFAEVLYPMGGIQYKYSQVQPYAADVHSQFPLFRHAKYVDVTVVKGDILYLPVFWYHDVSGESGRNISINYWYRQHPMKLDYIDAEPPTSPLDSVVAIE